MRTQGECAGLTARQCFERCLETDPENERAWAGYARTAFNDRDYVAALDYYRRLSLRHEDHQGYQLNEAVCLTNLKNYDEALKILYKLNYDAPDNRNVNRVLAWTLTGRRKYEQALKIYDALLADETPEADDLLNAAYCHWFYRQVSQAITLFRRYAGLDNVKFDARKEFLDNEASLLADHGITPVEVQLMIDQL
jgi:tetratricopeptide (TPR) repeat protein